MSVVYIYALVDPETHLVRYVGKTVQTLANRLSSHCRPRSPDINNRRVNWVKSLVARGLRPQIRLLDIATQDDWERLERFYIKAYQDAGFDLVNCTAGGDMGMRGYVHSPAARAKMKAARGGAGWGPEHRAKLSIACSGWHHTPEARAKMSASRTGKLLSPTTRAKLSAARKAWWASQRRLPDETMLD